MAANPTPRILPSHLHAFAPSAHPLVSIVRVLGTITSIRGLLATLESSNHDTVTLVLSRDSHVSTNTVYEVLGKVSNLDDGQGLGIRVLKATEWPVNNGVAIDMKAYEAVVEATHRYRGMFYEDGEGQGGEGRMGDF